MEGQNLCFHVTGITKKILRWHVSYNETKNFIILMFVRIIF